MTADDFPSIALCMQGAVERAHMKHPDFRANGRIFATLSVVVAGLAAAGMAAQSAHAQGSGQLQLPNPYRLVESWPTLPPEMNGGKWGELIRAQLDPDGNIWIFHRCFNTVPPGAATCVGRSDPPILQFAPSGRLLASLGGGMFAFPHGFTVDPDGQPVDDGRERRRVGARDARPRQRPARSRARQMGHQVFKLSPAGEVLMTIGRAGVAGNGRDTFNRPTGVAVAPNGDIFVTDGHGRNDRVVKFSRDGRFIKTWGRTGTGPGEFDQPHDMSIGGSRGRVFVADRSNNRVQIFDQDGNFIAAWTQFGRPSALHVAADDTLYVSDSTSNSTLNPGYVRGITVGSALDGSLRAFIPDPDLADAEVNRISGASGITADAEGSIFAADVGPHTLRKYVKASP